MSTETLVALPSRKRGDSARDWLVRAGERRGGLAALALAVGAGAGVGAIAFRELILAFTHLATGRDDYSFAGHVGSPHLPFLGIAFVLVVPVIAGLIYGPLVQRFAPEARGHGVPEVMYAVGMRGGRIAAPVAGVKALASALCIGAGGSVGREGPIVQIGSALGSTLGRAARMPASRLRLLVACGAAGGIAATFNAPLAGVFFAMELILGDFAADTFGLVVLSSVTASVIGRAAFGSSAFLSLPVFQVHHVVEYLLYAVLGLLGAVAGVGFTKCLYAIEDGCDWLWHKTRGPEWLRPGVGGLLLGLVLLALPEMYGVGYPVLGAAVAGHYGAGFLLVLLAGKVIATSLTIGIGGSGGVFAPSLFCGAMLGEAFGIALHAAAPGVVTSPGSFALVGMAAVFTGAARAPITAVVILFELTGEYSIILPLMLAVVIATGTSRLLSGDTIYTLKLRRRGIDLTTARLADPRFTRPLVSIMQPFPQPVPAEARVGALLQALATAGGNLPVVNRSGRYLGVLTASAAEDADPSTLSADIAAALPMLHPTDTIERAIAALSHPDADAGLPVVGEDGTLTGWIDHPAVLRALADPSSSVPLPLPTKTSGLPPEPAHADPAVRTSG